MYKFLVKTLPIEFTGLRIKEWDEEIPSWVQVEDLMDEIINPDGPFVPDYGIRGYYHYYNNHTPPLFFIDSNGPHMLYLSGIPKITPGDDHLRFRINNPLYLYCWEDTKIKYVTQIIDTTI